MNVTGTTSSGSPFLSLDSDSVQRNEVTSLSGQLALLVLDSQEQQKQIAHEQLANARHDFSEALADEVQSLRDEADAAYRGALVSGALSIAGSGLSAWGTESGPTWQKEVGDGLSRLSAPAGTVVGTNYGASEAKAAQGAQEAAKWQIDDAQDELGSARDLQNKALDWTSSMADRDAATTAAILANKA